MDLLAEKMVLDKSSIIFLDREKRHEYNMHPVYIKYVNGSYYIYDCDDKQIATVRKKDMLSRIQTLAYITTTNKKVILYKHKPWTCTATIIAMQYLDYKDIYKSLVSEHTYSLLSMDNNSKSPSLFPDTENEYDSYAVALGTPDKKYGYIAKRGPHSGETLELRQCFHNNAYKKGFIKSYIYHINTANTFYRQQENVLAKISVYLDHPLYQPEPTPFVLQETMSISGYKCRGTKNMYTAMSAPVRSKSAFLVDYKGVWQDFDDPSFFGGL